MCKYKDEATEECLSLLSDIAESIEDTEEPLPEVFNVYYQRILWTLKEYHRGRNER